MNRRTDKLPPRRALHLRVIALIMAAALAGCTPATPAPPPPTPRPDLAVAVLSHDLAVGPTRMVLALADRAGRPVTGGPVALRLTPLSAGDAAVALTATAQLRPAGVAGVATYVASVRLPQAGAWQVRVEAPSGSPEAPLVGSAVTEVHPVAAAPAVGSPAPPVLAPHLADGTPLGERTSLPSPNAMLYPTGAAALIGQGRPAVLVFAAPSLCSPGVCAAQVDVLAELHRRHGEQFLALHIDPYPTQPLPAELPAVLQAWNLRSQPWTFVVDGRGLITDRFEGFVGREELGEAVARVLPQD